MPSWMTRCIWRSDLTLSNIASSPGKKQDYSNSLHSVRIHTCILGYRLTGLCLTIKTSAEKKTLILVLWSIPAYVCVYPNNSWHLMIHCEFVMYTQRAHLVCTADSEAYSNQNCDIAFHRHQHWCWIVTFWREVLMISPFGSGTLCQSNYYVMYTLKITTVMHSYTKVFISMRLEGTRVQETRCLWIPHRLRKWCTVKHS